MAYTTINKPSDYFNTKLYTGTGSELAVTGVGFQPDWTWIKNRDTTDWHRLLDSVRGATKELYSNESNVEATQAQSLKSFDSNGFTLGTLAEVNTSGEDYASWNWLANGAGSSNTDGSITATVSANTTAGFSIVKWTAGSGVSGIGHGLGVIPKLIICKDLSVSSAWTVGSDLLNDWGGYLGLQSTNALNSETRMYKPSGYSSPTASLFYQDHSAFGSAGENMIAYCFAEKKGYSRFSSFVGNGSTDGTFVYTGFKPAFVVVKKSSEATGQWRMMDSKRSTSNVVNKSLYANLSNAESSDTMLDFTAQGFKMRSTDQDVNKSGVTYIFMAFAESSIVSSNGVPAVAR